MPQIAFYRAFGLIIASEQRITSLVPVDAQAPDVEIHRVPDDHEFDQFKLTNAFANWRAGPDSLLLHIESVAEFHVTQGTRIEIKPSADASDEAISAFLIGSAFSALLQQRRMLTLHASAVLCSGRAVLFVGRSGIGKSTTMTALQARGFEMVTDDVAAIEFGGSGEALIRTSFPGTKLTGNSLEKLGKSESDHRRLKTEIEKFALPTSLSKTEKARIASIFVLDSSDDGQIAVHDIGRAEAFQLLSRYTFRKRFYDGMAMQAFHFDAVSKLAQSIPVLRAVRPDYPFLLDEFIACLVDQIVPESEDANPNQLASERSNSA